MTLAEYNRWLGVARKHSRRGEEAADLLQDALLIAAREERLDFSLEENRRWFSGVLRNHAAMIARTELRRRQREAKAEMINHTQDTPQSSMEGDVLSGLPPSAKKLAVLILHGLTRVEILFVLRLSETAYRQRLSTIRKALSVLSPELRAQAMGLAYHRNGAEATNLELGLIRRALRDGMRYQSEVGTHDPDGHLILLRSV